VVCGSEAGLALFWEHAPDLWSVRALAKVLTAPAAALEAAPEATSAAWHPVRREDDPCDLEETARLLDAAWRQGDPQTAAALALRLGDALGSRSRFSEALAVTGDALDRLVHAPETPEKGNLLTLMGTLQLGNSDLAGARRSLEQARDVGRRTGAMGVVAGALVSLGGLDMRVDRLGDAERAFEEALRLYRQVEEGLGEANSLRALGELYSRTARLAAAERAYQEALSIFRRIDEQLGEATSLHVPDLRRGHRCRGPPVPVLARGSPCGAALPRSGPRAGAAAGLHHDFT
jgi:tetratricopeptide (TPR) repeat protein